MFITNLDTDTEEVFINNCLKNMDNYDFLINDNYEIELNFRLEDLYESSDFEEDDKDENIFNGGYKLVFNYLNNIFKRCSDYIEDLKKIDIRFDSIKSEFDIKLEYIENDVEKGNKHKRIITYRFKYLSENNNEFYEYFEENFNDYFNLTYFDMNIFFRYIYCQNKVKYSAFESASFFEKIKENLYDDDNFFDFQKELIDDKIDFIKYIFSIDGVEHFIDIKDADHEVHYYENDQLLIKIDENVNFLEL